MAKRTKKPHRRHDDEVMDKPAYAMDIVQEKPKKPAKQKPSEDAFHVADTISSQAASQLAKLKEQLVEVETPKQPVKPSSKKAKNTKSAADRLAENPDLSFAELFDPQEDDESFEEMLDSSKLDWQMFKDE